jgi:O-antigen ligase
MIDVRRLSPDFGQAREVWPRALLALLTLVAVVALFSQPLLLSALAVGLGILAAMAIDQRLVIPIIVLLLPLEIGSRLIPILQTEGSAAHDASALSLARMALLAAGLLWAVRAPTDWWRALPRSSLYLPFFLLLGLAVLSLGNAEDLQGGMREVARLLLHLVFFLLIVLYVRDRQALRWVVLALVASGLVVALIGILQEATNSYLWNEDFLRRIGGRRNATFVNSSYYARFLVITMVMATALLFQERSRLRYALLAALALAALALPFTSSRSNWMAAALLLPLLLLVLPISARMKINSLKLSAVFGLALIAVVLMAEPELVDRFRTIGSDWGGRFYLIRAGGQMFLDHPLFGIGLDGYEEALQGRYSHFTPGPGSVTQSHTAVVTVMAELGILGLAVLALLLYRFGQLSWRLYREASVEDRTLVAALVAAFLAIFISSYFAEFFLEDPYLWLVLGLTVALAAIKRRELQRPADPEVSPER